MSFTVFLGNLPTWVTADDIRGWLSAENLVADAIKVIRNPETQESKGFAFIDAPNTEEMNAIIRRFDRAPLEDRLLRANPAQPPKPKGQGRPPVAGSHGPHGHGLSTCLYSLHFPVIQDVGLRHAITRAGEAQRRFGDDKRAPHAQGDRRVARREYGLVLRPDR